MQRVIAALPNLAFPEVADAMRRRNDRIIEQWRKESIDAIGQLDRLTPQEFVNAVPELIDAIAHTIGTDDLEKYHTIFQQPLGHGIERYMQDIGVREMFMEVRILRTAILEQVEDELARQCTSDEATTLHAIIDIIFQQSVIALVEKQKAEIRRNAEVQVKFLAYLSHDLNNQFLAIAMQLERLRTELKRRNDDEQIGETNATVAQRLGDALATMRQTQEGMRKMLEHEQLRTSHEPTRQTVNLRELAEAQARRLAERASNQSMSIEVDIPHDSAIETDPSLLTIVLQNLLDNAIKHNEQGTVRITAEALDMSSPDMRSSSDDVSPAALWKVSVTDDGRGISAEQGEKIRKALNQGSDALGTPGLGLGLIIAAQAAHLLTTSIKLESEPGTGSTFSFLLRA